MRQMNYVNNAALNLPLVSAMTNNHNECATSTGSDTASKKTNVIDNELRELQRAKDAILPFRRFTEELPRPQRLPMTCLAPKDDQMNVCFMARSDYFLTAPI